MVETAHELFASPDWAEVLRRAYGFAVARSAGGFPYVALDDLAGRRVSALPFADYLPLDDPAVYRALAQELRDLFPTHRILVKTTLAEPYLPAEACIVKEAVYHRYAPGAKSSSSFRRGVRKAIRGEITVRRATDAAALDRFYRLYHWQRLRKFGSIPQPLAFFRAVHQQFVAVGKGYYLEAVLPTGTLAASLVVLRCGRGWFYKFGASDPDHLGLRPNNLLFSHLTESVDGGEADFLDLGLSGASDSYAGLRRFKASIGASERPIHYLASGPELSPTVTEFKGLLGQLTDELVRAGANPATVDPLSARIYPYFA